MNAFRPKWGLLKYIILVFVTAIWLSIEFYNPVEVVSNAIILPGGIEAFSAPGLRIQHIDRQGTIWSARGYWVYKSSGAIKSNKAFKVPIGNWIGWMGNFRSIRALMRYTELFEVFPLRSGTILAFSGGYIWRSINGGNTFQQVHKLRHFGIGRGRGVMPQAMAEDDDGAFYYGEYFRNDDRAPVFVYRSMDDGKTWEVIHRFNSGEIRHIHSLQFDPYRNVLWITTGDNDHESMIGYFIERGRTFYRIGSGSQKWRAVSLLFTKDAVFWGTDSPHIQNWIYRLERKTGDAKQVSKVDGPIYYSTKLCDGTLIMGRTVEGDKGEWDDMVSLWASKGGEQWIKISLGERKSSRRYAFMRFAGGDCAADLYTTPFNTEHYDEALLRISIKPIMK